jgi:hypothetical protein
MNNIRLHSNKNACHFNYGDPKRAYNGNGGLKSKDGTSRKQVVQGMFDIAVFIYKEYKILYAYDCCSNCKKCFKNVDEICHSTAADKLCKVCADERLQLLSDKFPEIISGEERSVREYLVACDGCNEMCFLHQYSDKPIGKILKDLNYESFSKTQSGKEKKKCPYCTKNKQRLF